MISTITTSTRRRRLVLAGGIAAALSAALLAPFTVAGAPAEALVPLPGAPSLWHDLRLIGSRTAYELTKDVAGDVWYYDGNGPQAIVRVDRNTHAQTEYLIPDRTWLEGMVGAPDGSLWYTNSEDVSINRLDPGTGMITTHPLAGFGGAPEAMALGADGKIWLGDLHSDTIASVDSAGVVTTYPEPRGERVFDMVAGPDGRVWYARSGSDNLGALDPITGVFSDLGVPEGSGFMLAVGASGSIWLGGDGSLTEVGTAGSIEVHPIPSAGPLPIRTHGLVGGDLAGDGDGEVFFVSPELGFSSVDTHGHVHSSPMRGSSSVMVVDGLGHLWINDPRSSTLLWM